MAKTKAKAKAKRKGIAATAVSASTGALPATRSMTVIAQDPNVKQLNGNILMACIDVPAEVLGAGPVGYRVQVVDFDSSSGKYHGKHSLPVPGKKEPAAWRDGDPSI